jgi:LAGLIDADG endonuclease
LIPIFEEFPLNTTKHLDYLAFKKAFFLFSNRRSSELNKPDLYSEILELKHSMNTKRVSDVLPRGHEIRITGNYLVGLLEGDGSFYFNKQDLTVRVSLVTTTVNRVLLDKIREFLINHLDKPSGILGSSTKLINIYDKSIKGGNKPISILEIYQVDYICNILIPFLDEIQFRTKKHKDYADFRCLAFLTLEGKYLTERGRELMIKLADTMNNNRLSTNSNPLTLDTTTKSELELLVKSKPLINIDSEGRAMIISENKYIRSTYIIKAIFLNGSISYFTNGVSCAKALHVSNNTITRRLDDSKPVKNKDGLISALKIQRIKAYSPKSYTYNQNTATLF